MSVSCSIVLLLKEILSKVEWGGAGGGYYWLSVNEDADMTSPIQMKCCECVEGIYANCQSLTFFCEGGEQREAFHSFPFSPWVPIALWVVGLKLCFF